MALVGDSDEQKIWNYLFSKLGNVYGVAGICGNIKAESNMRSNNMQDSYERKIGYNDETYTAAVDNGTYTKFISDKVGYGLVQWTFYTLKRDLLSYAKSKGTSIGDLEMQLEFLCKELQEEFPEVWKACKEAKSITDASNYVLLNFERPSDMGQAVQKLRAEYGQAFFDKYAKEKKGTTMADFKMLIMAGHGRNVNGTWDSGATGNNYEEAILTRELRDLIKEAADAAGVSCDVAPDRNHYSFFKNGGTYDVTAYNYVFEVHFNASATVDTIGDGKLKGSMFYIDQSEKGHSVEDAILNHLYAIGSTKAWDGVVITQRQWPAGLLVQNRIRAQGVSHAVLETCFVSDKDDMKWYQANKKKIAEGIIEGIIEGFGLKNAFMVRVLDSALNIRSDAGTAYKVVGCITDKGSYTIVETKKADFGNGTSATWGKLKSGIGWICLDHGLTTYNA